MSNDKTLVERLRRECPPHYPDTTISVQRVGDLRVMLDRIEALTAERDGARRALDIANRIVAQREARIEALGEARDKALATYNGCAAIAAADQWRPIETAPKDGTHILLGRKGEPVCEGFYDDWSDGQWACDFIPTHWRPMPKAPEAK